MENKATYTLHKLTTQNQNQSYILSIKTDETIFSYLIYFNQNKPIVKRIINALELLSYTKGEIERIDSNSEEYKKFITLIAEIKKHMGNAKYPAIEPIISPLSEQDLNKLAKK